MEDLKAQTFIAELAQTVLTENEGRLDQVTVIFPNRRAGLFFRQALAELISKPIWMPDVISMQDFVSRFSTLKTIETLEAVFRLFEVYKSHQPNEESFDQFFFWGEMIVRDFEEIDQYLVNPERLFTSIKSQKELDEEFYFLDEEDKRIIQSFWSSFLPKTTRTQEAFLETWKILLPIYQQYHDLLKSRGEAYGGMVYREVAEHIADKRSGRKLYFAGFNALTFTEEKIIRHFVLEEKASVIWDLDDYYVSNKKQEAGYFLRTYKADSILGTTFPKELPKRIAQLKPMQATGVSLEVGQTKALAEHLRALIKDPAFNPQKTVIVLPKEHMLFPVLHAIPDEIDKINITMGFPLKDTPVYSLLEAVLQLQHLRKDGLTTINFYYKPVLEVLEHPLLYVLEEDTINGLIKQIKKRNRITLTKEEIPLTHPIFALIFQKPQNPLQYLMQILRELHAQWKEKGHDLELEFISRFYLHISELHEMLSDKAPDLDFDFLIKLFRRLARSLKIPFTGEPLNGLQVMGILETRNLDFDHVFILNMNEDSWPAAARRGSFIPFNIRKAFDMPVFDHQDAIYAYLFYRLLQRAKHVHFFYNTVSEFNINGEISRLVQQLEVESGKTIEKKILASPIKTTMPKSIRVEKNEAIRAKMERYIEGFQGQFNNYASSYTPSALNTYLDCSLRFYFKYVEKLYEPEEVQEEMEPMVFGNILHDSMEILYTEFKKRQKRDVVYEEDIFWIREGALGAINKAFIKHYDIKNEKKFKLEGRSLIAQEILNKFIRKILDHDKAYTPFKIVGLEASKDQGFEMSFPITIQGKKLGVKIHGIIDRIDYKEGTIRVVDYKTGRDEKDFQSIASLIDRNDAKRNKAVFQVFYYSYLVKKKYQGEYTRIEPGLFNSRDLFSKDFEWKIINKPAKEPVLDFSVYAQEFEEALSQLLTEIYDPEKPFEQTDDEKKCSICPYVDICGR